MVRGGHQRGGGGGGGGGNRFQGNRGGGKFQNRNRIQKSGQVGKNVDFQMNGVEMNGRSRGSGNRGQGSGRGQNNRNGRGWAAGNSRAANTGNTFAQNQTGSALDAGGAVAESMGNLDRISVRGWVSSKVGTDADRGAQAVLTFLARKTTPTRGPESGKALIQKSEIDGDSLIISVMSEDANKLLRLNNYTFAGASLEIKLVSSASSDESQATTISDATILIRKMTAMIARRYNLEMKLLDLSALRNDVEFANTEVFATPSRNSKFFPALMKVCDSLFESSEQKTESVLGVSLANNALSNLALVTTLSQTFPGIEYLDMSNNDLPHLTALEAWQHKFRSLDSLVLSGNPLETADPDYKTEVLKWFPRLRYLNNEEVRSTEEVAVASKTKIRMPIYNPSFRDEVMVGENFIRKFFLNYDTNRAAVANTWYDANSSFSISVNVSALNVDARHLTWEDYIGKSRNLTKVTALHPRMDRMYKGVQKIRQLWPTLPSTRHPDVDKEPQRWCIECHSLPGLPDPTGQSPNGVGGLIVTVHGEFAEYDVNTKDFTIQRSFDRTFVLGPGAGVLGVRVVSDIFVVRAYGGSAAWKPDVDILVLQPTPHFKSPEGFGLAVKGKLEEDIQKELIALEFTKATRMTLEYSAMCLEGNAWNPQAALRHFEELKANLPPEAFI